MPTDFRVPEELKNPVTPMTAFSLRSASVTDGIVKIDSAFFD